MTDQLKPCPFCGPGNSIPGLWFDDASNAYRVNCGRCGSGTGFKPHWTEADAAEAWNTRALASRPDGWSGIESAPRDRPFWARKSNNEIALCWRHNPSGRKFHRQKTNPDGFMRKFTRRQPSTLSYPPTNGYAWRGMKK